MVEGVEEPDRTIFIVDDDLDTLRSERYLLESLRYRVSTSASPPEFFQQVDDEARGCVLLDWNLGESSGMEVIQELNRRGLRLPIILMTAYGTIATAVQAMREGAIDVLEKPIPKETLVEAIQRAFQCGDEASANDRERQEIQRKFELLTQRELEVLRLVVNGHSSKKIANELDISPKTVEAHRSNIARKTQTENVAELVRLYVIWEQGNAERR